MSDPNKVHLWILTFSLIGAFAFQGCEGVKVVCADQQEICECPADADACEFRLEIEELQTFTSYLRKSDTELRGPRGDTYFINSTGFHSPLRPPINSPCYFETLASETDFPLACTIPSTVDGSTYRSFIAVNGRIPGPTLIVSVNQIIKVTVVNRLINDGVTVHWHGIFQMDTPWMDGVAYISQPGIVPGAKFDYIFKAFPSGTFWYHSHLGTQRTDGLFGALVIRETPAFFDKVRQRIEPNAVRIEDNHTLTLVDWQRDGSLDLFIQIHGGINDGLKFYPGLDVGVVPTSNDIVYNPTISIDGAEVGPIPYWSGLINGRGRFDSTTITPLTIFEVEQNNFYRFRLVGAQGLFAYKFSIDGHILKVIATDGDFIEPIEVDYIIIHSGERYDFLLNTGGIAIGNYWIRAETLEIESNNTVYSILHYRTAPDLDFRNGYDNVVSTPRQCNETQMCSVLNCPFLEFPSYMFTTCINFNNLSALFPQEDAITIPRITTSSSCSDCMHFLNFGFMGEGATSSISGRNFHPPTTPYQTYCGQYDSDVKNSEVNTCGNCVPGGNPKDCVCTHVETVAGESTFTEGQEPETIMMVFSSVALDPNDVSGGSAHPIHLHGHSFYVVYIGYGEYNSTNGRLIRNSPDIVCGDTNGCLDPQWADNTRPEIINMYGVNGRVRNNAIRKDTVIVPAGGYVLIAFLADNPGYWFLHCHIEIHQIEGMAVLIQEYDYTEHAAPPQNINRVGDFRWSVEEFNEVLNANRKCAANVPQSSFMVMIILLSVVYMSFSN